MEPQRIFEELTKADELQTHLGISKENVVKASYMEVSNSPMIEVIKDVINGVANNKATNTVFQGILKKVSDKSSKDYGNTYQVYQLSELL